MHIKKHKLLIADDELNLALTLKKIFKENDFEVEVVDNGVKTVEMYHSFKPDVILMDIDMPGKNGWEALHEIRKNNKFIPILIMSGNKTDESDYLKSYEEGANFFVAKGFFYSVIVLQIKSIVKTTYGCDEYLYFDDFQLDMNTNTLLTETRQLRLKKREAKILYLLCKNKKKMVDIETLLNGIGCSGRNQSNDQMLRSIVSELRKILQNISKIQITNFPKKGYMAE